MSDDSAAINLAVIRRSGLDQAPFHRPKPLAHLSEGELESIYQMTVRGDTVSDIARHLGVPSSALRATFKRHPDAGNAREEALEDRADALYNAIVQMTHDVDRIEDFDEHKAKTKFKFDVLKFLYTEARKGQARMAPRRPLDRMPSPVIDVPPKG